MVAVKELDDPRDAEIARLKARVAELEPVRPGRSFGKAVSYDWNGIEKKVRSDGQINQYFSRTTDSEGKPGFLFDRSKYLYQNKLPSPTYRFHVTVNGPAEIKPSTIYAVDESEAVAQVIHKQIGSENAHRYTCNAIRL